MSEYYDILSPGPIYVDVESPRGPQGPPGPTGVSEDLVIGEIPSGAVNGVNATFTALNNFVPETVEVFLNGLRQTLLGDYNTSGATTIQFVTSPASGDIVRINYIKA